MTEYTSGPAFPPQHDPATHPSGMTLRDYFAARASEEDIQRHLFTGRIVEVVVERTNGRKEIDKQPEFQTREQARYAFADAMLAARKQ